MANTGEHEEKVITHRGGQEEIFKNLPKHNKTKKKSHKDQNNKTKEENLNANNKQIKIEDLLSYGNGTDDVTIFLGTSGEMVSVSKNGSSVGLRTQHHVKFNTSEHDERRDIRMVDESGIVVTSGVGQNRAKTNNQKNAQLLLDYIKDKGWSFVVVRIVVGLDGGSGSGALPLIVEMFLNQGVTIEVIGAYREQKSVKSLKNVIDTLEEIYTICDDKQKAIMIVPVKVGTKESIGIEKITDVYNKSNNIRTIDDSDESNESLIDLSDLQTLFDPTIGGIPYVQPLIGTYGKNGSLEGSNGEAVVDGYLSVLPSDAPVQKLAVTNTQKHVICDVQGTEVSLITKFTLDDWLDKLDVLFQEAKAMMKSAPKERKKKNTSF